jgi:glyoxylase-like metal-dependent hydrolase (beta-lactamase superfamily II)
VPGYSRRIGVGDAVLTVFEAGKLTMKVSEIVREGTELPPGVDWGWQADFPVYSAHISLGGASVVLDPCDYEALCPPGQPWRPKGGYVPPPSLLSQLSEAGVGAEEVTHVIITHSHLDHCIGSTVRGEDGSYVPAFPKARYYLGAGDWNSAETRSDLQSVPDVMNSLGVLGAAGVLTLIDRETEVSPGITIVPAPGESPGHQIVRVASEGARTLYCIGDLFHEPMDVADPRIMAAWNDPETNLRSRAWFLAEASLEDAPVFAGHMSLGRIRRVPKGYAWEEA